MDASRFLLRPLPRAPLPAYHRCLDATIQQGAKLGAGMCLSRDAGGKRWTQLEKGQGWIVFPKRFTTCVKKKRKMYGKLRSCFVCVGNRNSPSNFFHLIKSYIKYTRNPARNRMSLEPNRSIFLKLDPIATTTSDWRVCPPYVKFSPRFSLHKTKKILLSSLQIIRYFKDFYAHSLLYIIVIFSL